jgi:CRISPR-associated protein Cmr1
LKKKSALEYKGGGSIVGEGARYLGYGVLDPSGGLTRQCIGYPFEGGTLELLFRSETLKEDIESVEAALIAMSLLGGLGSRSRKGYGSFNLTNLTRDDETESVFTMPSDLNGLKGAITSLFDINSRYKIEPHHDLPPYTAFSEMTRIDIIDEGDEPLRLLNSVGEKMLEYRSYRKGRNFLGDYRLIREALIKTVTDHPKRAIFGLPHNYYFSSTHDVAEVKPKDHKRRASPLFIHIQQLNKDQYAAIAAIFPADFLPKEDKIMVEMSPVDVNVDYEVLNDFIDGKGTPRFESRVRVI